MRTVELLFKGNNRSAVRALAGIAEQSDRTTRKVKKDAAESSAGFRQMGESAGRLHGIVTGLAGTVGLGGLAFGIKDVISAGQRWQVQQTQLQGALKATGAGVSNLERLSGVAESLSTHGGFTAPENMQALTQFVTTTHSAARAQSDLTLATDISRRTGKSFTTVVRALMMLENGRTTGLARLGIAIPKVTAAQEALHAQYKKVPPALLAAAKAQDALASRQQAFANLQAVYAGATSRYSNTTSGRISNMKNAWEALQKSIGVGLLPVMNRVVAGLAAMMGWLDRNRTVLYAVLAATAGVTAVLTAHAVVVEVARAKTIAFAAAQRLLGIAAGEAAAGEETATVATIAWGDAFRLTVAGAIITALVLLVTHFQTVKRVAVDTFHWIITAAKDAWKWIETAARNIYRALTWAFGAASKFIARTPLGGLLGFGSNLIHGHVGSALGSLAHGLTFGLLHTGGVVRPKYLAAGGPVGTDTVPGWLTPGEGVVNTRGMSLIGEGGLAALNAGSIPGTTSQPVQIVVPIYMGGRQVTKVVADTVIRKAARGPSSLVGGSLTVASAR